MGILDDYEAAHAAFQRGQILDADNEVLLKYLHGLSNQNNTNTGTQNRDVIRGLTINHLLLQRHIRDLQKHITDLNKRNNRIQFWVIALAIAALLGTVVQSVASIVQTSIAVDEKKVHLVSHTTAMPVKQEKGEGK